MIEVENLLINKAKLRMIRCNYDSLLGRETLSLFFEGLDYTPVPVLENTSLIEAQALFPSFILLSEEDTEKCVLVNPDQIRFMKAGYGEYYTDIVFDLPNTSIMVKESLSCINSLIERSKV